MRLYLDSDVWITLFDKRDVRHPIVLELFEKIKEEKIEIIITSTHFREMTQTGWINNFQKTAEKLNVLKVKVSGNAFKKAAVIEKKLKLGFSDCLHLAMAEETYSIPVSYDQHWDEISREIKKQVFMPGEILNQL